MLKSTNQPPTGRRIAVAETAIFRVVEDRIVEQWPQVDALSMMQQIGALASAPTRPDKE